MTTPMRRYRIALLVNFLDSAYQLSLRMAVGRVAERRNLDLVVAIGRALDPEDENERAMNVLYDWLTKSSIDGAIIVAGGLANRAGSDGIARLCQRLAPVHTCTIGLELPGIPAIIINNRAAMRAQVEHMTQYHGCRKIAYVSGPSYNTEANERLDGYRDALSAAQITFDPDLVAWGEFSVPTGRSAMQQILGRARDIDAVVAANDYMAQGAMETLLAHGLRVPENVLVAGFDDAPVARFALRSLTTAAQPIEEMAERAVDSLLKSMSGTASASVSRLTAHIMRRESCGCGYVVSNSARKLNIANKERACDSIRENTATLFAEVLSHAGSARRYWAGFVGEMIEALAEELSGQRGHFLRTMEQIAERLDDVEISLDEVGRALFELRRACRDAGYPSADHIAFEEACLRGIAVLSAAATRREGRRALRLMESVYGLREISHDLAMELNPAGLARKFVSILPRMGMRTALVSLLVPEEPGQLQVLLGNDEGSSLAVDGAYPATQLLPVGFPANGPPRSLIALPLTFGRKVLGLVVFGGEADPFMCEAVRNQLGAALELAALHARVVEETALRERLARDQLLGELAVARRIQTALIPRELSVPGLELVACMAPADQVGGDYYDVINAADGCWIAIGDVTGHGLLAGMIMLMMQSAVTGIIQTLPDGTPSQVVSQLNRVMHLNVRQRLNESEHATFIALRYRSNGTVTLAGAHDDLIVYRADRACCERYASSGIWLGITEDVADCTRDDSFRLGVGDIMLLYTDGLTEARSASGEMFGVERVEALLSAHAAAPAAEIQERLRSALRTWAPVQQDDVTLIVARRCA